MALLGFYFVLFVLFLSVSNLLLCYLCYYTGMVNHIYFGGSRNPQSINPSQIAQVVGAVVASGSSVRVGCQFGADLAVLQNLPPRSWHRVFAVHSSHQYPFNHHIPAAYRAGHHISFCAGGTSAPMPARYLLRSIAAFQGCAAAVFFNPGAGSLAVARECVRSGLPVFAFQVAAPAPVPSVSGQWVASSFHGFACWQWSPAQLSLF